MQYDNTRFPFHAYDRSCETRESRGRVRLPVTGYSIFQLGLRSCFFFSLLTRLNSNPAIPGFSILVSRIWNIIRRYLKVGRENSNSYCNSINEGDDAISLFPSLSLASSALAS